MARDKPANKQDHAVAGHLSHCAGISGARSNLTTSEMVRSGHSVSVTTQGWDSTGHPALPSPPLFLASHPSISESRVPGLLASDTLQMHKCRFPGLLKNLARAPAPAFSTRSSSSRAAYGQKHKFWIRLDSNSSSSTFCLPWTKSFFVPHSLPLKFQLLDFPTSYFSLALITS